MHVAAGEIEPAQCQAPVFRDRVHRERRERHAAHERPLGIQPQVDIERAKPLAERRRGWRRNG